MEHKHNGTMDTTKWGPSLETTSSRPSTAVQTYLVPKGDQEKKVSLQIKSTGNIIFPQTGAHKQLRAYHLKHHLYQITNFHNIRVDIYTFVKHLIIITSTLLASFKRILNRLSQGEMADHKWAFKPP